METGRVAPKRTTAPGASQTLVLTLSGHRLLEIFFVTPKRLGYFLKISDHRSLEDNAGSHVETDWTHNAAARRFNGVSIHAHTSVPVDRRRAPDFCWGFVGCHKTHRPTRKWAFNANSTGTN